jgi:hypothetical protein
VGARNNERKPVEAPLTRKDKQVSRLKSKLYKGALCGAVLLALLASNSTSKDTIAQAEKKETATSVPAQAIAEPRATAEEGFIYGLPIVMNYAVMYDYI